jgi:hypothetical protein
MIGNGGPRGAQNDILSNCESFGPDEEEKLNPNGLRSKRGVGDDTKIKSGRREGG